MLNLKEDGIEDEIDPEIKTIYLNMFQKLKLINLYIINNELGYVSGLSQEFVQKMPSFVTLLPEVAQCIENKFNLQIHNKFATRAEAEKYCQQHYPDVKVMYELFKNNDFDLDRSAYKLVMQIDPTTNKVLAIYPRLTEFFTYNNFSEGKVKRAIEADKTIGGYKWKIVNQCDAEATTTDLTFQNILNADISEIQLHPSYLNKKKPKFRIVVTDADGNTTEYDDAKTAAMSLGLRPVKVRDYSRTNHTHNGLTFKYKKI